MDGPAASQRVAGRPPGRVAASEHRAGARAWQNPPCSFSAVRLARSTPGNEEETRRSPGEALRAKWREDLTGQRPAIAWEVTRASGCNRRA